MRDRKKRNITIISLCCLLVFMAVGYAVLSQALNINGTANLTGEWKVYIDSITEIAEGNTTSGKSIAAEITGEEKTDAHFEAELIKPGDYVEYKVIVKNEGNIDASLRELVTSSSYEHPDVKFNHTLEQGTVLKGGDEKEFTVKVEFLRTATEIPEQTVLDYTMRIVYEQFDGNTITTPPNLETDNSCFTVSADGTLEGYDYNCGLDVTVPASVNGINITKINETSFTPSENNLNEMGWGKYREIRFNDAIENTHQVFRIALDDSYNKMLEVFDIENILKYLVNAYYSYSNANVEDIYAYIYSYVIGLGQDGKNNNDDPKYVIYSYFDPEEFYVVETQEAYDSALIYLQGIGVDASSLYVAGDPDIPRDTYRVKLIDIINGKVSEVRVSQDVVFYTDGNVKFASSLSNLITGLDLSNAINLEEITTYNQFKSLEKLTLPTNGKLVTIGVGAFENTKLTKVTIPNTVKTIGTDAFAVSNYLEQIRMEAYSLDVTLGENWNGSSEVFWINN